MMTKQTFKKLMISGLAATMILGGATSAFANGKGKDNDRDRNERGQNAWNNSGRINFNGNVQIILKFDDVQGDDVEWATKNIASLASKRVFEGYEDGTFQPRKVISRIEAITAAVRLLGLRDKAESSAEVNANLNFKDADKIRSKYPWAVGYVAVAAENDLFLESDDAVQPEKAADRLWATTLLVKALKLDGEAKAKINTKLTFQDADKIPAGSVGYVAVAVEKGLIKGYEDNTFRPNRPVTRSELAALLDRTDDQLPSQDNNLVTGKLTASANGNILSVLKGGVTTQVVADPNAFVFRNGARVTLADLKAGDEVKIRTYNNTAIFIEVTKPSTDVQTFDVNGLYNNIALGTDGKITSVTISQPTAGGTVQTATYSVSPTVTITGGSLPAPNRLLELKGSNALVTQIDIK